MQIIEQLAARLFGPELAFIAILAAVLFGTAKAAQHFRERNHHQQSERSEDHNP